MMKISRILTAAALATLLATTGFAALSQQYADFGKGPAQHLMTKDELAKWKAVKTDEEAKAFIDLFWARRDPTPTTPANEFKINYEERVRIADERYAEGRKRGSLTDRGRVFLLLGAPTRMRSANTDPGGQVQTPVGAMGTVAPSRGGAGTGIGAGSSLGAAAPKQLWVYEQSKTPVTLDTPTAELAFIDQYSSNEWKIETTGRTNYVALLQRAADSYITQPSLTVAPTFAATAGTTTTVTVPMAGSTVAPPAAASGPGAFKTDALRIAVDEIRAGKAKPSNALFVSYGEFITPAGDYFVPVSLTVPQSAGLTPTGAYTFFGVVEKDGTPAAIFEEPAKLTASRDDLFYDKSLTLEPGKYKATFGLAENGKPVSIVTTDLNLTGLNKDATGISNLILSNNIYALSEAQAPTEPFAFGGMKVVPKADRTFRPTDELWYFFELRNPGIDTATNAPKTTVKMSITGKTTAGQNVKMNAPVTEMQAQELKGVPGHYAVGASIPLTKFRAGDYTVTLQVTDVAKNQTYDLKSDFKVLAP